MNTKVLTLLTTGILLGACSTPAAPPSFVSSSACHRLGDASAAVGAFYEPGNVHQATKVDKKEFLARAIQPRRTMGAELYMHAPPDVSGEYLQRALSCHAASGVAARPSDPLHPSSGSIASITVRSAGDRFAVKIVGDGHEVGKEIWQRAQSFASPSSVSVEQLASVRGPSAL